MFRNNYDNDAATFSPQGRIFQVEYAGEAVKQGSAVVGIAGKDHVVLAALKRNAEELSSFQDKLFKVADNCGLAISGISSEARLAAQWLQTRASQYRLSMGMYQSVGSIAQHIGSRGQEFTQYYGLRPYGMGLLFAGVDDRGESKGPHLYEFQPSGLILEYTAWAIGSRSQMSRTYLERNLDSFADAGRDDLVRHALKALRESLGQDKKLTVDNTTIGVVGIKDVRGPGQTAVLDYWTQYDNQGVREWLDILEETAAAGGEEGAMQVDDVVA